ncbi:MAG: hypothetical protein HC771_01495 [Synechococcales cyanobacterium CRU_2_2]|nr:hypothetical protein [Synechococcales cyanobacterium CRU_2_2]
MTPSLNQTYPIPGEMSAEEWQRLTQDPAWQAAVDEAEQAAGGVLANGFQKRGWMKTWPELPTYSHYMQMRSLVLRGFDAILREGNLGVGYQAASDCGKTLVYERFFEPGEAAKVRLLALVEGELLGPPPEMTPERLAVLRSVLQGVLTAEDWGAIAQAAAQQVQQQVLELRVA